jgi:predicted nucleic acid-binding protein
LAVGLQITGALGLLARAKVLGIVSELAPLIEKLKNIGAFYDEELLGRVLEGVGERPAKGS